MFIDTHCHLTAEVFDDDRAEVLERARQAGVSHIVSISSGLEDSRRMSEFVSEDPRLKGTVGIHPHQATEATTEALLELDRLASGPGIVAMGETGLDYHYGLSPKAQQLISLGAHMSLAIRHDLPLVVHSRSAVDDTMAFLDEAQGKVRGVLHCFSGPRELLDRALDIGWMLSFTGIATFKSFEAEMLARVPSDRYMLETDSPYLAPIPHRGKRNEPSFITHVAEAVAAIRGCSVEDVAKETTHNASTFFRLDEDTSGA